MSPALRGHPSESSARSRAFVEVFDGRYYRIEHAHALPVFFMNIVSASDLWLFAASNGALTAGRGDADHALFPYRTVDQIIDSAGLTGPATFVRVLHEGREVLWEPFAAHTPQIHAVTRQLYKSIEGDRVWFEETNHALGLTFRSGWATAEPHGFIRRCELVNLADQPRELQVADALRNLLPPGITARLQATSSCLADAYKTAELLPGSTLAVYSLAAAIVDRAVPMEALCATAVWSDGLPRAQILLTEAQLETFCQGVTPAVQAAARGVRGTYGVTCPLRLAPGETRRWVMVADTGLTQPEVVARYSELVGGSLLPTVEPAIRAATARLRALVSSADGVQAGGEETATAHHFANALFNILRGGVFADDGRIAAADFAAFVQQHNRAAAERHADVLRELPAQLPRADLLRRLAPLHDPTLVRLASEYLPLTFSRRHGDPSRPWNRFQIRVRDAAGRRVLAHEGNWRDIFQNWEALCLSFPEYFEATVAKFLNASTLDGYNPYRISHLGIDWEVPDAEDPWASIGYWGDHQVIYLLKLLEWTERFCPGALRHSLREPRYSYAAVPYRLASYGDTVRRPRETITFAADQHRDILSREAVAGSDARLVCTADGEVVHVSLIEKLLLLVLTRLTNFVPGGGIWMNTQRPEWNDANNALVGYGVSFVTLAHLRRLLAHLQAQFAPVLGNEPVPVSRAVVELTRRVHGVLARLRGLLAAPRLEPASRRAVLDALGEAGSDYRAAIYRGGPGEPVALAPDEIRELLALAQEFADHTLRSGRRADGLYESYSRLEFTEAPAGLRVLSLYPMLEGQVAILSSGLLTPAESLALLRALRASSLYRADQHSYLLYPDRTHATFLGRNRVPPEAAAANALLAALLAAGDSRVVVRDAAGTLRFQADLVNADALQRRLEELATEPEWSEGVARHGGGVHAVYEAVFHHRAFTGRSGSMFGYEGLGCIYWHMVAKLLLAVQEVHAAAVATGAPEAAELGAVYHDVRAGLGFNKSPAVYGAFPTDPYSHTPGHAGAQQPGMTGQVKEELLTRWGELGVRVAEGRVEFRPLLLRAEEFTSADGVFHFPRPDGSEAALPLPAGALAFSLCGVPVIYRRTGGKPQLQWETATGTQTETAGRTLPADVCAELFARSGHITRVEVALGATFNPFSP